MESDQPTPPDRSGHPPEFSDDYDSPWKEAVEHCFPEFMAFYFPAAYARIDWSAGHEFLDQELRAVVQDMAENRYGCAVIVEGAKVVGVFTTTDALRVKRNAFAVLLVLIANAAVLG